MPIVDVGPKQEVHPPPLLSPVHAQIFCRSPIRENSTVSNTPEESISVVLPIHNAQSSLPAQFEPLLDGLSDLAGEFQLVLVDDASTDATPELLDDLQRIYPQVESIRNTQQLGPAACVRLGLERVTGDILFVRESYEIMGMHDLSELWKLRVDPSIVMARARIRTRKVDDSLLKKLTDWGKRVEASWFGKAHQTSELHMYRRQGIEHFLTSKPERNQVEVAHLSHRRIASPKLSTSPRAAVT